MTLTPAQHEVLEHLRASWIGPDGGPAECVTNLPNRQYAVGMLFPADATAEVDATAGGADPDVLADVLPGELEEADAGVPLAEDWRPASVAVSFLTDAASVHVSFSGGTYALLDDDGPRRWQRRPFDFESLTVSRAAPKRDVMAGDVPVEVGSRWRNFAGGRHLVTVHARVLAKSAGDDRLDIPSMLFQVALAVRPADGGRIHEYDTLRGLDLDAEAREIRLRYRARKVFAVGHGMAADWLMRDGVCSSVSLDPVPSFIVPAVETTGFRAGTAEAQALELAHLAMIDCWPDQVLPSLEAFVGAFEVWVREQEDRVAGFERSAATAHAIVERCRTSAERMRAGVDLLREEPEVRTAFALGMTAMRLQMRQAPVARGDRQKPVTEPQWRPFQLGFLLVALASTLDERHDDRELVDLIWFPTGGGKTEAYLALAAVEIFRRRLADGAKGGGTAVLTRYTLRLLTAQQFQRASSLVCAMELMRRHGQHGDDRVRGMSRFSIGLWVGNDVTPGSRSAAKGALDRLRKAAHPEQANQFQVEACPWCGTAQVPRQKSLDPRAYGFRLDGKDLVIHCTNVHCEFHEELPVQVVDELLYEQPPTILLATVDKFARLQFKPEAGRLLGIGTTFRQPSLVIQDELHLLSGPLGTTVAVFDAVIQVLLGRSGGRPKIVASTATIRSAAEQVRGLYGRQVALYPPAGLDEDRTFFSRPVESGEGRLYVGLMPQSVSQASAAVAAATPLLEVPEVLKVASPATPRDAYWTAVMYHNSLRELGRTGTLVVDDVNGRLEPRSERLSLHLRRVRADRVLELTSRRGPEELPNDLRELGRSVDESDQAVDVVLSSNMLSVGIDVPRLSLMLMVGQPKTTAEYIQATSRVGRGDTRGVVATLFRSNRARDRSHFETFRGYHDALYRGVEPTSVTPWSLASRDRSLAGALVALLRQSLTELAPNAAAARFDLEDDHLNATVVKLLDGLLQRVSAADQDEYEETEEHAWRLMRDWDRRAAQARESDVDLVYDRRPGDDLGLLKRFGQTGEGWLVADSMRSVDPNVAVEVQEPFEERSSGTDQA
ncbi:helicase-related protein [Blastococcus saxobsidens]|uniref:Putative helicase family protein n=1 Tax=Blastococcus saxobsidens (strain DD2) TaxID=1146883 RepID=H6RTV3_BLASD|nr:helicase-related protein [Blastococcus saxobsidens]CCG04363.1 Putative helicase family protein [Blastococcus saxobsidens DD2]